MREINLFKYRPNILEFKKIPLSLSKLSLFISAQLMSKKDWTQYGPRSLNIGNTYTNQYF
jgi:hypothetical protein